MWEMATGKRALIGRTLPEIVMISRSLQGHSFILPEGTPLDYRVRRAVTWYWVHENHLPDALPALLHGCWRMFTFARVPFLRAIPQVLLSACLQKQPRDRPTFSSLVPMLRHALREAMMYTVEQGK